MFNVGEFLSNALPLLLAYIILPLILLALYFGIVRPMRRRADEKRKTDGGSEALQRLNQAKTSRKVDTGELPDLDLLVTTPASVRAPAAPTTPSSDESSLIAKPVKSGVRSLSAEPQTVRLYNGNLASAKEVLSVLRDQRDGRLIVQFGDFAYRSLSDTPEAKREFTRIMKELSSVILAPDDGSAPPPVQATSETPAAAPTSTEKSATPSAEEAPPAAEQAPAKPDMTKTRQFAAPPPIAPDGSMPGDLPSYRFDDNPARIQTRSFRAPKIEFDAPPELDIPTAIETYLQYKLQFVPEFKGRRIHVLPSITGGVRITVDDKAYDFVDDVEDEDVRAFLKDTIAEWQSRQ